MKVYAWMLRKARRDSPGKPMFPAIESALGGREQLEVLRAYLVENHFVCCNQHSVAVVLKGQG